MILVQLLVDSDMPDRRPGTSKSKPVSLLVLHQQPLIVTWHIQQNVQKSATAAEGVTVTFQGCLLWFCFWCGFSFVFLVQRNKVQVMCDNTTPWPLEKQEIT